MASKAGKLPPIVIDTREQTPLEFGDAYETVRGTLSAGDYSLVGLEERVAVERKSKSDAYACVGRERRRFEECVKRLALLDRAAIVIEADITDFVVPPLTAAVECPTCQHYRSQPRTRIKPNMAVGSFISWDVQYNLRTYWAPSRAYAARYVVRFLAAYLKHRGE